MGKTWDDKLSNLSVKLDELSRKVATASEDAKTCRALRHEAIEDRISTAKGNMAAMQENARIAEAERRGRIRSALLKARMTARVKYENLRESRDRRRMENYIDDGIAYILECYDSAAFMLADAELTILEVSEALREYEDRFGGDAG